MQLDNKHLYLYYTNLAILSKSFEGTKSTSIMKMNCVLAFLEGKNTINFRFSPARGYILIYRVMEMQYLPSVFADGYQGSL